MQTGIFGQMENTLEFPTLPHTLTVLFAKPRWYETPFTGLSPGEVYLDHTDSRANIYYEVGKYFRMIEILEDIGRTLFFMKCKHLIRNVFQQKVATSDDAFNLIFFVKPELKKW